MACVTKLLYETRVYSLFLFFKYAVSLFRTAGEIFVSGNVAKDGIGSTAIVFRWKESCGRSGKKRNWPNDISVNHRVVADHSTP